MCVLLVLLLIVNVQRAALDHRQVSIDFEQAFRDGKLLPRFWTSTGLCPPAPREKAADFLLSDDSLLNFEIIGGLPNAGLKYVRIHWLLEMIQFSHYDENKLLFYNFSRLDALLDKLYEFGLHPGIELMGAPGNIYPMEKKRRFSYFWTDLTMQIALRYLHRFGVEYVANWRFETWNEPDLKNYNTLNFTTDEYINYLQSARLGLDAAGRLLNNIHLPLRGPAGLFRTEQNHPFCWTALQLCNDYPRNCPFDVISFHRKGSGTRADEIVNGESMLLNQIWDKYPNLLEFKYSNDEADPVAGWSTPREFQSNMKYGAMLVSTVLQHWSTKTNCVQSHLESISHDNGFLSYHPFEFDQRTLLARFQMNDTKPKHVQFVVKPVYSSLGMLTNLGPQATDTLFLEGNFSYIVSYNRDPFYSCVLLSLSNDTFDPTTKRSNITLKFAIAEESTKRRIGYIVEGLQDSLNDPNSIWIHYGKPSYPTADQFVSMRALQFPSVLKGPETVSANTKNISLNLNLRAPWIVTVRLCSEMVPAPSQVTNIRIRRIYTYEAVIFWSEKPSATRCIVGYEVWFRADQSQWIQINLGHCTPFLWFQFVSNTTIGLTGLYRVRSVDMFGRYGAFSETKYFNG
ncbi:alpha-L-iduronidase-like [Topomyia yanbarensis]|uniref:alpha-L-iduronidase-like n=1 Tax=Topomyia yanbarensis TaxID=2498891 RepID=UPI00273AE42D|nr:alpha-L-iduronidase-like [Topomyia yanbarensis]